MLKRIRIKFIPDDKMTSRGCGSFQRHINEVNDIEFCNFVTPWNFLTVFLSEYSVVMK